jgi:hypothetical protein
MAGYELGGIGGLSAVKNGKASCIRKKKKKEET